MIKFLEKEHIYLNDKDERYSSVTSLLKEFEPKKDWNKIRKNYAKKHGMSEEEVAEKWEKIKNDACNRGTAFHKFKELETVAKEDSKYYGKALVVNPSYCIGGIKTSTESLILKEGIYPELIIWLDSAKIAGQADLVIISDGLIHIEDYKTNKKIDYKGYVNWEGKEEMLEFPLNHLGNCNYNIYSLQLSLYMYMLLRHNPKLKPGKMKLLHVQFEQDIEDPRQEIAKAPVPIEVEYKRTEIQNIINKLKTKK